MAGLVAGYTRDTAAGRLSYHGALRRDRKSAPLWACLHDHLVVTSAQRCAEAELERREQGQGQVFSLLTCAPCGRWWADARVSACPLCSVPLQRVKLAVLESGPA